MYAIAGVSGHTGSIVANTLLAQGKAVRVIVRDGAKGEAWRSKGAEVAVASLSDEAATQRALSGVAGAYLLLPPNVQTETPIEDNARLTAQLTRVLRAAKVPHVVLLSSVSAQHATGNGPIKALHHTERAFVEGGVPLTAIRASYFQENWGSSLGMLEQGVLPTFIEPSFAYAQVATADIGRAAASALVEGPNGARSILELAGPREYSAVDVAAALSEITGKTITAQQFPLDAVVPTFASFGISKGMAELYREMYEGIGSGRVAPEAGNRSARGTVTIQETLASLLGR